MKENRKLNKEENDNSVYVSVPLHHLGILMREYLDKLEIVSKNQKVNYINIPVDVDEENNFIVEVGLNKTLFN